MAKKKIVTNEEIEVLDNQVDIDNLIADKENIDVVEDQIKLEYNEIDSGILADVFLTESAIKSCYEYSLYAEINQCFHYFKTSEKNSEYIEHQAIKLKYIKDQQQYTKFATLSPMIGLDNKKSIVDQFVQKVNFSINNFKNLMASSSFDILFKIVQDYIKEAESLIAWYLLSQKEIEIILTQCETIFHILMPILK